MDCMIHEGCKNADGYGRIKRDGKNVSRHRWEYEQVNGEIPQGEQIHHTCGIRACYNVDHLVALTLDAHKEAHGRRVCPHDRTDIRWGRCRPCLNDYQREFKRKVRASV